MSKEWGAKKINLSSAVIGGAAALAIGILVGLNWNTIAGQFLPYLGFQKTTAGVDWSSLDEVYSNLQSYYDGSVDQTTLIEGAKKGIAAAVDDTYTVYMDAEESASYTKSLHGQVGGGIGVEIGKRDDYIRVVRTLPDNPARRAGILAGDILYKVDGKEVYDKEAVEVSELVRGEPGTSVDVTIVRDKEEKTYTLTREEINNVSAELQYLDDDTAYIRTTRFDTDTGNIIAGFAKEIMNKGVKKVILDLRGNGGGYTSAARDLLSLWIDGEPVFTQKSKSASTTTTNAKSGQAILKDMNTVVLVNSGTASASEIVAGALQDYGKATILGEKTYGKGVVQSLLTLSDGNLLKVTSARWYTPKGNSINEIGITPDKEVINEYDDVNEGKDPQLDAAKAM